MSPVAIEACERWLDRPERTAVDPVQRVVAHLVLDLGDDSLQLARSGQTFLKSETLFALATVPSP